jgi:hypothetical protein
MLYIDDGTGGNDEAMFVNSVSGTAIGVTRGYNGTQANLHLANAQLSFAGPPASFRLRGSFRLLHRGECTFTPTVNIFRVGSGFAHRH